MALQDVRKCTCTIILLVIIVLVYSNAANAQAYGEGDAQYQQENRLREALLSKYNLQMLPPINASALGAVKLGVSLIAIRNLDPKQQILTSEAWLKLKWSDSRLRWEPYKYGGIKKLRLAAKIIWKPDIQLYNSGDVTSALQAIGDVLTIVDSDGGVIWVPPVTLRSLCAVDLKHFPYDQQHCTLKFGSWTVDGFRLDVQLIEDEHTSRPVQGLDLNYLIKDGGEWEVTGSTAARSLKYYKCCKEPYPDLTFGVSLKRRPSVLGCALICPVLTAVAIALAAFALSPFAYERITLNCLSLFTLLLSLIHLAIQVPSAGNSIPVIAAFSGSLLMLVTLVTIGGIVFIALERTGRTTAVPSFVNVILKSVATKILCVGIQKEPFANHTETNNVDIDSDDVKRQGQSEKEKNRRTWLTFYRFIDRVIFAVFVLILVLILIIFSC